MAARCSPGSICELGEGGDYILYLGIELNCKYFIDLNCIVFIELYFIVLYLGKLHFYPTLFDCRPGDTREVWSSVVLVAAGPE